MAIKHAFCNVAKLGFLNGVHQPEHVYMLALYTAAAQLGPETKAYTEVGEVRGAGYKPGGQIVTRRAALDTGVAFLNFDKLEWRAATITARGALLYNATAPGRPAIAVLDFGKDVGAISGTFTVQMPQAGANTALVRIV